MHESTRWTCKSSLCCLYDKAKSYYRVDAILGLDLDPLEIAREVVRSSPLRSDRCRPNSLRNLGEVLIRLYERKNDRPYLEEAVRVLREAVPLTSEDDPFHSDCSLSLGRSLLTWYMATGDIDSLEESIKLGEQVLDSKKCSATTRVHCLNHLSMCRNHQYQRTTDQSYLDEAIQLARRGIDEASVETPGRARRLGNLGGYLVALYERTGSDPALEEAITILRGLVTSTPTTDSCVRLQCLSSLAGGLEAHSQRTGNTADRKKAIELMEESLKLDVGQNILQAIRANNLSSMYLFRFWRERDKADLDKAVDVAKEACNLLPKNHPFRPGFLGNLGNKFELRYTATGDENDLNTAIHGAWEVLKMIPEDHSYKPIALHALGWRLYLRYQKTDSPIDLDNAITHTREANGLFTIDDPYRGTSLNRSGSILQSRYELKHQDGDLNEALFAWERAWDCSAAIPFARIEAGARYLSLFATALSTRSIYTAIRIGKGVVDLLPIVNTRQLSPDDKKFAVSRFGGVAADLCSLLLQSGQYEDALQYLEKGRTAIINQLIDARSDFSDLEIQHPGAAQEYRQLLNRFNTPTDVNQDPKWGGVMPETRLETLRKLDEHIQHIRGLAGQERFLLGLTTKEMRQQASEGSIIFINMTAHRSDAIIVSTSSIEALELPLMKACEADTWINRKWAASDKAEDNKEFEKYLSWLWETCVKQVLGKACIHHGSSARGGLPRIWWIGSGLAHSMPFHAAGIHSKSKSKGENTFSMVMSAYTPSVKALAYSRKLAEPPEHQATGTSRGFVLVTRPAKGDSCGFEDEKASIVQISKGCDYELTDEQSGRVEGVVGRLGSCSIAHFACHGRTDSRDPSNSGLDLDKNVRLTVGRVAELMQKNARLAYLSACSTAANEAAHLSDEVIHIVSGFQVAGFPFVIGCLWEAFGGDCAVVVETFYSVLLKGDLQHRWGGYEVAVSLREAVGSLREDTPDMPLCWAPFIQFGA